LSKVPTEGVFRAPIGSDPRNFGFKELYSWASVWRCLRDDIFSHLDRTTTYRRTHGQTDGHGIYRASI